MQTGAILLDSLRLLRSRKLFWISLGISVVVMLAYASIGFGENGLSLFFGAWELEDPFFTKGSPWSRALYLGLFSNIVVTVWLTWAATILALVSTSSVFPDFMSAGSIELVLSKPISRVRVFLVKYLGSLLFVLLQVLVFCTGVFICVGVRLDEWLWSIFAAVPLVTIFFSYLYAFNVLMGLLTRSGLAALLFTAVFWFLLFAVQSGEAALGGITREQQVRMEALEKRVVEQETRLERLAASERPSDQRAKERVATELEANRTRLAEDAQRLDTIRRWHGPFETLMAVLPKNQETIGLLDRWLAPDARYTFTELMLGDYREDPKPAEPPAAEGDEAAEPSPDSDRERRRAERRDVDREATRRVESDLRSTSALFIVGTSLAFEAVILALAAWIFARRDF